MQRLSFIVFFCFIGLGLGYAQSPHGDFLKIDCASCHNPDSWGFSAQANFNHDSTHFPLTGQHRALNCKNCHQSLKFEQADETCISCHADIHQNSVGTDCKRCHSSQNWLIPSALQMHENAAFPLIGVHRNADCRQCHTSSSGLDFTVSGVQCIDCHLQDFKGSTSPSHEKNHFSTNCTDCHTLSDENWKTDKVDHAFFPLEKGHDIQDCKSCHQSSDYSVIDAACVSCHLADYQSTNNPSHLSAGFENNCALCHTTDPDWKPAKFSKHDVHFPIYSGGHQGKWMVCTDCHQNPSDFKQFTCTTCHTNPETDEHHQSVNGYIYSDNACLACHPSGDVQNGFNHDQTAFPLTGAHQAVNCLECHSSGFKGTPTDCQSCHTKDYQSSQEPSHSKLNLSTNCIECHTTAPGWAPAKFDIHDQYYVLEGAHRNIAQDCKKCHLQSFSGTANTCTGCHKSDYDQTKDPDHRAAQFPEDCASCHNQTAWVPATFNHDGSYFPIYSGKHKGVWTQCIECHKNQQNYQQFTCIGCHTNPETDQKHTTVNGYLYQDNACFACHPTGDADFKFDHNATAFPLTGAHQAVNCLECHSSGFKGTSSLCQDCHTKDFESSQDPNHLQLGLSKDCSGCHTTNPGWAPAKFDIHDAVYPLTGAHSSIRNDCNKCHQNGYNNTPNQCVGCHNQDYAKAQEPPHSSIGISTDCASCHSTNPGWAPAKFDIHDQYYVLKGAHKQIAMDCKKCHQNGFTNTPNTCVGCHKTEYDQTTNPNHKTAQFPEDCASCHNESAWMPTQFDHDGMFFPVFSGKHKGVWTQCIECHTNPTNFSQFSCLACHNNPETDEQHKTIGGYVYDNNACFACHPTGDADFKFDHNATAFPLTGAHMTANCLECHQSGYKGTSSLCQDCHNKDFEASRDPNHVQLGIGKECSLCHTTNPGWSPSKFDNHDALYPLTGAHSLIKNDCNKCHQTGYNNTPNTCVGCHLTDHETSQNPPHKNLGISTDCASCHTTAPGWTPAKFDVHDDYYVLQGAHKTIANDCIQCHNGNYTNTPNTCVGCHQGDYNNTTNPNHQAAQFPTDCTPCHGQNRWSPSTFNHDGLYFPIYSGTHKPHWSQCMDCHLNPSDFKQFTCISCHKNPETDQQHPGIGGYVYQDFACLGCHPTGEKNMAFDHNQSAFPLTGAHIQTDCKSCHKNGFQNTPTDCFECHKSDFDQSNDPDHKALSFSNDCAQCHTTAPGWKPAKFDDHNRIWVIDGEHLKVANNCTACHQNGYSNTPNNCYGCHQSDYNNSTNPNHNSVGFQTDCEQCHTNLTPDWKPAKFDDHNRIWVIDGEHLKIADNCAACHQGNYNNTPSNCSGCHLSDYNNATNPNHKTLNIPLQCEDCHSTSGQWTPASFDIHDNYYPLLGAHALIKNNCTQCHSGNYSNTPNTCYGCHQSDYNGTNNPNHSQAQFPTTCENCHSQSAWDPSTFDHDGAYFPIYSGKHDNKWNTCSQCHPNSSNYTVFNCLGCHTAGNTNPDHNGVSGYQYNSNACYSCHPDGEE